MLLRRLIGLALRRARQRQGLTLREVAALARVSVAYLSEVERGRKEASSEVLAAICRALGLRLADLLDDVRDDLARLEPVPVPERAGRAGARVRPAPVRPAGRPAGRAERTPPPQCSLRGPARASRTGTDRDGVARPGTAADRSLDRRARAAQPTPAGSGTPTWAAVATTWSMNPYSRA